MRARSVLLAVAAGLALADASVVTLALPQLLHQLHTTVEGVASVLGVYTIALAAALVPAERWQRRVGPGHAGAAGLAVFSLASVACGASGSLAVLLVARAVQAAGGAAALVSAFALLGPRDAPDHPGRRLWLGAAVLAAALGPALGGAMTQAFSWRAIFYVQAPVTAAAALVAWREPRRSRPPVTAATPERMDRGPAVALGLISAALTAVLFLLVLLLVAGWDVAPLRAALAVTIIPAGALLGSRISGDAATRAAAGCALVGTGVLALAYLPDARLLWTVAPQAAAGVGMGLALPALGGELLPERDARDAARLLVLRHAGIALALVLLAPVVSHDLANATERARLRGVAIVLDAPLPPAQKLGLAPGLLSGVQSQEPRAALRRALDEGRVGIADEDRPAYATMARRSDETLVLAVGEAFRTAFLVTGALALMAALAVLPRRRLGIVPLAAATATAILPVGFLDLHAARAPAPVALRNPCTPRPLPRAGGLAGFVQDRALEMLDATACRYGSSREELVLALTDDAERRRFREQHGVDPLSSSGLLAGLLG